MQTLLQDTRFGLRMLARNPGFTAVAVLTLALGIGANTAIFSVVDSVLLQSLPFPQPDRLVRIFSTKNGAVTGPSPLDLRDFAQSNHSFDQMAVFDVWRKNVSGILGSAEPEQMRVGLVPAAFFQILRVRPVVGRVFTDEEGQYGNHYVAAISANLWRNRFAGVQTIIGEKFLINDEPYTIVAVMPDAIPDWVLSARVEVWTPFAPSPDVWSEASRGSRDFSAVGRLKASVSVQEAQADLAVIADRLAQAYPIDQGVGVVVRPLADTRTGPLRPVLVMLVGAVGLILLIACTNLANLLLARNSARWRELTVRMALGAGRWGLVRHLLAETLLLSFAGGGLGLALAWFGCAALAQLHPERLPQLASVAIDSRALLFTLTVSLATGLLFGVVPALASTDVNVADGLRESGRTGTAGTGRQRLRQGLVIMEMALSLMLLISAGLLIQSIVRLERQSLGFREDHLLKGHIYLPPVRYSNPELIARFCDRLGERLRALPGVEEASVTAIHPPSAIWTQMFSIEGRPAARTADIPTTHFGVTDDHYLRALGIPLIAGRDFSEADTDASLQVALVNQEFVRRYFAKEDPVGRRIHLGRPPGVSGATPDTIAGYSNPTYAADVTVIGVMGNAKNNGLALAVEPQLIALYRQQPEVNYGFKDIVVRTASEPHLLAPVIGKQLHEMDAEMPFAEVETMHEFIQDQAADQRFVTTLLSMFAIIGLVLAVVGIYGVLSYLVAQRTRELGVRCALGASRADVLWLVLRQALTLVLAGTAIGLLGAAAARQLTAKLLFGMSLLDPFTYGGAAFVLLAAALLASAIPARRATKVDPLVALRYE